MSNAIACQLSTLRFQENFTTICRLTKAFFRDEDRSRDFDAICLDDGVFGPRAGQSGKECYRHIQTKVDVGKEEGVCRTYPSSLCFVFCINGQV
jgi:hypothetical protein